MKLLVLFLSLYISSYCFGQSEEISLFNSNGKPIAYVDTNDDDLTIYLWDGKPVAYLSSTDGDFHIYGFNGQHLGWFINGIIRDHQGNVVGSTKDATSIYKEYEPYKSYKQYKPYKSYKSYAPYKPYLTNSWSSTTLRLFLMQGINN